MPRTLKFADPKLPDPNSVWQQELEGQLEISKHLTKELDAAWTDASTAKEPTLVLTQTLRVTLMAAFGS